MQSNRKLVDVYSDLCTKRRWKQRKYIIEALQKLDDYMQREENMILLLLLPTGYGKTTISETLLKAILDGDVDIDYSRVIHVLPMKSIINQFAERMRKNYGDVVAEEHGGLHESPYYAKRMVITTFESFYLNLIKLPPLEMEKAFEYHITHHFFSRGMILSSIVFLDEIHLLFKGGEPKRRSAVLISVLETLYDVGVTVILSSATLDNAYINFIEKSLGRNVKIERVIYGGSDQDYDGIYRTSINLQLLKRDLSSIPTLIASKTNSTDKTLVMLNTVRDAVRVYKEIIKSNKPNVRNIYNGNVFLIHGALPEKIKSKLLKDIENKVNSNNKVLVVSTHSLEAGVDLSFDRLISVPAEPSSIIQRLGRVSRYGGPGGEIVILDLPDNQLKDHLGYYDEVLAQKTLQELKKYIGNGNTSSMKKDIVDMLSKLTYSDLDVKKDETLYVLLRDIMKREDIDPELITKAEDETGMILADSIIGYIVKSSGDCGNMICDKIYLDWKRGEEILKKHECIMTLKGRIRRISKDELNRLIGLIDKRGLKPSHIFFKYGYKGVIVPLQYLRDNLFPDPIFGKYVAQVY